MPSKRKRKQGNKPNRLGLIWKHGKRQIGIGVAGIVSFWAAGYGAMQLHEFHSKRARLRYKKFAEYLTSALQFMAKVRYKEGHHVASVFFGGYPYIYNLINPREDNSKVTTIHLSGLFQENQQGSVVFNQNSKGWGELNKLLKQNKNRLSTLHTYLTTSKMFNGTNIKINGFTNDPPDLHAYFTEKINTPQEFRIIYRKKSSNVDPPPSIEKILPDSLSLNQDNKIPFSKDYICGEEEHIVGIPPDAIKQNPCWGEYIEKDGKRRRFLAWKDLNNHVYVYSEGKGFQEDQNNMELNVNDRQYFTKNNEQWILPRLHKFEYEFNSQAGIENFKTMLKQPSQTFYHEYANPHVEKDENEYFNQSIGAC